MRGERTWVVMALLGAVFLGMLSLSYVAAGSEREAASADPDPSSSPSQSPSQSPTQSPTTSPSTDESPTDVPDPLPPEPSAAPTSAPRPPATLPGGRARIFADKTFLVAYYGTASTGALGVLGETDPDTMVRRLRRAAKPFERPGSRTQIVFELIVTVADAGPGKDGDFNHDIDRRAVQKYIDAAHEHDALLILDIQPGRSNFFPVVRRWKWALKDPYVGLALDPEWRMGRREVPGQRVGSVSAAEVNKVSKWLNVLAKIENLPQKLFVLHQFRTDMIRDIRRIAPRNRLAMVQHVDGFGNPGQKLDTYRAVRRPEQFWMGFKLFYDEDHPLMRPAAVRRLRPGIRFVSYQ